MYNQQLQISISIDIFHKIAVNFVLKIGFFAVTWAADEFTCRSGF